MSSPPTPSTHTGVMTRRKPPLVAVIVTSADGAPRLSTLAHTPPIAIGITSSCGSMTNGAPSAQMPRPVYAPGPQLGTGTLSLPSRRVAIASASPGARRRSS